MTNSSEKQRDPHEAEDPSRSEPEAGDSAEKPVEIGGPKGPEPTRYGDWEKRGRCIDF